MKTRRHSTLLAAFLLAVFSIMVGAQAHTLPVSYLQLMPDSDFLHLELTFNPFELTFISEADTNKDGELSLAELQAHGQMVAERVVAALKIRVSDRMISHDSVGMDPDLSGHHVRMRAHYKVDARNSPLIFESELNSLMSASHLTQVTYAHEKGAQRAQLDSQSHKVTFKPPMMPRPVPPPHLPENRSISKALWAGLGVLMVLLALIRFRNKAVSKKVNPDYPPL